MRKIISDSKKTIGLFILGSIILIALLCFLCYLFFLKSVDFSGQLKKMGVEFRESDKFILENKTKGNVGDLQITNLITKNEEIILRLEQTSSLSQEKALKRKSDYFQNLEALFLPSPSPYSEFITNQIECPKEFWPVIINDSVWQLYASDRFVYGVCSDDLTKFISLVKLKYCSQQKSLFKIEVFISYDKKHLIDEVKEIINSFRCIN
ncbi:hypothetical protein COZ41_03110 [Candidatus Shapirobacteria bacterium CG_4_10_14_3_um_filter_35_13]|uniref:Uncharacterized protein n=2 Tax=Patescibacteria group TaxID=1783273 RepID=A0A2M7DKV1_9BACT|nr:MAG: hypothetical protein COS18_05225 [Candidatus Falkowbacteria bacterium CG02_land_8_20_14_3_00_36_14]PIX67790.1 MAG: hypothetical protein COZ41_03110 [Candidatus Shapirobacteria bacterium CG_4_10_14_3_um_filter_35_13]